MHENDARVGVETLLTLTSTAWQALLVVVWAVETRVIVIGIYANLVIDK